MLEKFRKHEGDEQMDMFPDSREMCNRQAKLAIALIVGIAVLLTAVSVFAHHTKTHEQLIIGEKSGHAKLVFCEYKELAQELQTTAKRDGWDKAGVKTQAFIKHRACNIGNAYIVPKSRGRTMDITFPDGDVKTTYVFPFTFYGHKDRGTFWGFTDLDISPVSDGGQPL